MAKRRKTILCIDDDRDDLFLIRESIHRISDNIIEIACDGKQALDILQQQKLSKCLPSLIVADINMPKMDGTKMLKAIKKDDALRNIPVVVFTTSPMTVDQQFLDSQHIETIAKPTDWASYEGIAKRLLSYCK